MKSEYTARWFILVEASESKAGYVFNQSTASMIRRHVRYMRVLFVLLIFYDPGIEMRVYIPKTGVH